MADKPLRESEEDTEIWQTHIHSPETAFKVYCEITVEVPELESAATKKSDTRSLVLSEGGDISQGEPEPSQEWPFVQQSAPNQKLNRTLVHETGVAIGYYLHHLETHDLDEGEAYNSIAELSESESIPIEQFQAFIKSLTARKRRIRLLDLLEFRVNKGGDWAAEPYIDTGRWRDTDLDKQGTEFAQRLARQIDPNPQHCYRNAQEAAIKHADNYKVDYFEGIALPKQGCQVSRHAWIEYENSVVELTWPWHKYNGCSQKNIDVGFFHNAPAVYFGKQFDCDTVKETFERRNGGSQIALSDEQVRTLKDIRS